MYSATLMRLSLVLFFGYWCGTVDGFASGAPRQACSYMTPSHYTSPQTGPSYMTVTIEDGVTSYEAGDEITVNLSGSSFKGFMIQARAQDGGESIGIGQFKRHPDYSRTSREVCSNDVAITHENSRIKTEMKVVWVAPTPAVGDIYFVATVVKTFSRFWTNIRSDVLSEPQPTTQPPTTVFDARSFVDIANATTLCQDDQLEALPEQRPYVGILCGQDLDCPCGWICCPQCQEDNRCDGHPICRQTKYQDAVRQMQEEKLSKVAQDKDADKDDDKDKDDGDEKDGNGV